MGWKNQLLKYIFSSGERPRPPKPSRSPGCFHSRSLSSPNALSSTEFDLPRHRQSRRAWGHRLDSASSVYPRSVPGGRPLRTRHTHTHVRMHARTHARTHRNAYVHGTGTHVRAWNRHTRACMYITERTKHGDIRIAATDTVGIHHNSTIQRA